MPSLPSPRATGLAVLACLGLSVSAQPGPPAGVADRVLPQNARAQLVLDALRPQLPEIARRHGRSPTELEATIRRDRDLWFDAQANLYYVCEGLEVPDEALGADGSVVSGSAVPNSTDAFKLHSLPGAARIIYLDFNGHTTSGTQWNASKTGGADIVSAPFDFDGNPGSWSTAELDRIKRIWQRVAEDFSHFAVDVTTEAPALEALRRSTSTDNAFGIRVVISPSSTWYGNAGGVAYLGSFQWNSDTPCYVFSDKLGPNSEKYVAEAVSHEVGHTLGLAHDGQTNGTGYYQGHGDWAPIMGVGYYRAVSQWSKGEYSLANNTEDDLARMPQYGAPVAVDDHGNSLAAATVLSGPSIATLGVLETRADVDVFRFNTGAGAVSFAFSGPSPAPNADLKVELLDSAGAVLMTSSPAGLGASLSTTLASGTYYLRVDGVGTGDPVSTGYSDYGSLGEYQLTGSIVSTGTAQPPNAVASATPISGVAPLAVAFSGAASTDSDGTITGYAWSFGTGAGSILMNPTYTYTTPGTYTAVLTVTDNTGLTSQSSVQIVVSAVANQLPVARASASVTSGPAPLAVTFSSAGSSDPDGSIAGYRWTFGDGSSSTAANPAKTYTAPGTYTATLTVTDDRGGTAAASIQIDVTTDNSLDADVSRYTLAVDKTAAGSSAVANVRVLDRAGRGVAGAAVTIRWSGLVSGSSTGSTNAAGDVVLSSKRVKKAGTISGQITTLTLPSGYRFDEAVYAEPKSRSVSVTR